MMRWLIVLGALNVLAGLIVGAYTAHGLPLPADTAQRSLDTATTIHMVHGLGLCVIGLSSHRVNARNLLLTAGLTMLAGIVLFCGGIYAKVLLQAMFMGPFVPVGGMALMAGWAIFVLTWLRAGPIPGR